MTTIVEKTSNKYKNASIGLKTVGLRIKPAYHSAIKILSKEYENNITKTIEAAIKNLYCQQKSIEDEGPFALEMLYQQAKLSERIPILNHKFLPLKSKSNTTRKQISLDHIIQILDQKVLTFSEIKKMLLEGGGMAVMYGSEDVTIFYTKSYILKLEVFKSKKGNILQTKWSLVTKVKWS